MAEPNANQVSSDDDCEPPDSVNSFATSQGDVPVDDSDGIPASEHYWQTVSDLASDITRAAKTILSNRRPHFKKVVAVLPTYNHGRLRTRNSEPGVRLGQKTRQGREEHLVGCLDNRQVYAVASTLGVPQMVSSHSPIHYNTHLTAFLMPLAAN